MTTELLEVLRDHDRHEGHTPAELAEILDQPSAALAKHVEQLLEDELVVTVNDHDDDQLHVRIAQAGRWHLDGRPA